MGSFLKLLGRLLHRPDSDRTQVEPQQTPSPPGNPCGAEAAVAQVVFEAFERGAGGFHLKCRDAAGRSVMTSPLERLVPQRDGWHIVHTITGSRYQLYLTPPQVADFQRALHATATTSTTGVTATPAAPAPPVVQSRGFQRSQKGVHLRFADVQHRELVSSPLMRVDPLGNGWYTVVTSSGSRYRTHLPAAHLAELQRLIQPAEPSPQPIARPITTSAPGLLSTRPAPAPPAHPAPSNREPVHVGPPARTLNWAGTGNTLLVHGWALPHPLVYWSEGQPREDETSCIELRLPVGRPTDEPPGALGYWPRYGSMSPDQRANYLGWLAGGRTAVLQDIGYVFVYFYGLERRILVEGQDLYPALCEVVRLLEAYPSSRSFQSYGRSLVAFALAKNGVENLSESWFEHLVQRPSLQHSPDGMALALAWLAQQECPLPAAWARHLAALDERSQQSVVIDRVRTQFDELFAHKYAERFGDGFPLRCAKREHAYAYHPGSPSLLQHRDRTRFLAPVQVPNVQGITTQFKPLVEIWNECIEELRPLSRQIGKGISVTSRAAYEALPDPLRAATDHPDAARWQGVAARHRRETSVALVPVRDLAALLDLATDAKLTAKQGQLLAQTAQYTGFAVEPDVRMTRRALAPEDRIALYREERSEIERSFGSPYPATALILELGLAMAAADGEIDAAETAHISQFIGGQFELTVAQDRRLQALLCLFREYPPSLSGVGARLQELLTAEQREGLATFLIGVAAANGIIDRAELGLLRKAARALGLEAGQLDGLIAELVWTHDEPVEVQRGSGASPGEIIPARSASDAEHVPKIELNEALLRSIMQETQHVAQMLTAAMGEAEEIEDALAFQPASRPEELAIPALEGSLPNSSKPAPSPSEPEATGLSQELTGLDPRYHALVAELLTAENWSASDFQALVRRHGLFPTGTVEVVNEWAEEHLGDLLIEEGDPYYIQMDLVKRQG